jgi:uncharacterized protein DUF2798
MTSIPSHPRRSRKLPASFNAVAMPFVLSVLMSGIVSGVSTLKNIGFAADLLIQWLGAWSMSWSIAFPTLLLILPLVRRIVAVLVEPVGAGR